jgi:hypothetical protein
MNDWVPIRYLGFWDVPRNFLVRFGGEFLLFDCPFDENIDDYPDAYSVYALPEMTDAEIDTDWAGLPTRATRSLGTVPISAVTFDETRRKAIRADVFDRLGISPTPLNGRAAHVDSSVPAG